ncbi:hypothetical protein B0H14DRAFT_3760341 [Mycena olivaceomarginata]|nr:hypothetical protein B0H14DRAFT_3760341 [Mycena olivaceomarginata]
MFFAAIKCARPHEQTTRSLPPTTSAPPSAPPLHSKHAVMTSKHSPADQDLIDSLPTHLVMRIRSSIFQHEYIESNAALFVSHDWIDMAQLRKFLARVGHAIQPEVHPPLLPGRVMIEEDRLACLPSSAAIEIGGDLAVARQLSASGTSNTVKTRVVREGGIDILEILTYSESDEPQHGGTGSSEGSLLDQILNVLNIDSGLSSPLPPSDFESESTRTDTAFNLSSDSLEAEPELPKSDIPWLDKDVSSRIQAGEFRLTKNIMVEQLEFAIVSKPTGNLFTMDAMIKKQRHSRTARTAARHSAMIRKSQEVRESSDEQATIEAEIAEMNKTRKQAAEQLKDPKALKSATKKSSSKSTGKSRAVVASSSSSGRILSDHLDSYRTRRVAQLLNFLVNLVTPLVATRCLPIQLNNISECCAKVPNFRQRWERSDPTDTSSIFSTTTPTSPPAFSKSNSGVSKLYADITVKMLGDNFLGHFFFDLDNTDAWINPIAFQAYMNTVYGSFDEYHTQNSTPFSSRAPSRAGSSVSSRAPSRGDSMFSPVGSRPSSRASFVPASRAPSSRAPSPFDNSVIVISDSDSDNFPATVSTASIVPKIEPGPASALSIYPTEPSHRNGRKGKEKAATRPGFMGRLEWPAGDSEAAGFLPDLTTAIKCRRAHLKCKGVYTCEFIDPSLFAGCERYEPDPAATQALWKHELDANEREAASVPGIISREPHMESSFLSAVPNGLTLKFEHRYLPIPNNVDEDTLRIAMENDGRLPTTPTVNELAYTHIIDGQIKSSRLVQRKCEAMMIIFTPINPPLASRHKALVIVREPHNHPAHPKTKPSTSDQHRLGEAIAAAGSLGLTVNKLLNAPSTTLIYGGECVSTSSPAYMNSQKVMDLINNKKKKDHPQGMGWAVRDNAKAAELLQIEQKGVMRKRWNGVGEREKLSAQRKVWRMRKSAVRTDQLTSFESLKAERTAGAEENKASLQREKIFQSEIKSLQDDMKLDSHRSDLREQINILRREIEEEKDARRAWRLRQTEIDSELESIRKGPLAGVRINGRRPAERPLKEEPALGIPFCRLPETLLISHQILHLNLPSNRLKFQLHFKTCPPTIVSWAPRK